MFSFKEALQKEINSKIVPILKENCFKKYRKNLFIREKENLVQTILFQLRKNVLYAYAHFMPIYVSYDNSWRYGIEITGATGASLLDGKYFTTIYAENYFDRKIQPIHLTSFQKLTMSIVEGALPEMNEINSFSKFAFRLKQDGVFLGYNCLDPVGLIDRLIYKYILAIYDALEGKDNESYFAFTEIHKILTERALEHEGGFLKFVATILSAYDESSQINKADYLTKLNELSNEMRKKYKLPLIMGD